MSLAKVYYQACSPTLMRYHYFERDSSKSLDATLTVSKPHLSQWAWIGLGMFA
jgi:hypothetical protein